MSPRSRMAFGHARATSYELHAELAPGDAAVLAILRFLEGNCP